MMVDVDEGHNGMSVEDDDKNDGKEYTQNLP